ncbi:polysaccharide biosynthesis tyrosine autokinase [Maribacter sp. TH_r10]|uniref:GumC family protein n=1 Tax=Maribacter sp. TH_r10 TaxID=3082086 RepID=UPI0029535699|nr:polysaccharide biosynthesis tyrosine autokinase [Maribacter sp. TH_r10]MDV7140215.1 polysaccharide biosynthesis tyrosine autokinase [Maribacter sp. TH_r10]
MSKEQYKYLPIAEEESEFNVREILDRYLRYWPWFIIVGGLAVGMAFLYLKYTEPTYRTVSTIIIKDEDKGTGSDPSAMVDLGMMGGMATNSISNELGLLTSKRIMWNTVKALDLNVQYWSDEELLSKELYDFSPIKVEIFRLDDRGLEKAILSESNVYKVHNLGGGKLSVVNEATEQEVQTDLGQMVELDYVDFNIQEKEDMEGMAQDEAWTTVRIKFVSLGSVVNQYRGKLEVEVVEDQSTLIQLSLIDAVPKKAQDVLNQVVFEYNRDAIDEKNLIAKNTADFIDERLAIINRELDSVETGKEQFKAANSLTDIGAESNMIIQNVSEYNKRQQEVQTQLELTNSMLNYMNTDQMVLFPSNLGIEETSVNQLIAEYNSMVVQRNRLMAGSTEKNPIIVRLDAQIAQMKNSVRSSLQGRRDNLLISSGNLRRQSGRLGSQISAVPGQERKFRGIERQQGIKESLYLYLLQKREENTLKLTVRAPKAKLVDQAYSNYSPVSPNPKKALAIALFLGLLLPVMVIEGKELLNNKIRNRSDLEKKVKGIPILGELPKLGRKDKELDLNSSRSLLSESCRIVLANLQYTMVKHDTKKGGVCVFVTSTVKGEGKTFTTMNLAHTLATTGKKVIVVGADLRNPQLQRYKDGLNKVLGVSDYLVSRNQELKHLIQDSEQHPNLKFLPSGSIPPNPAELLQLDKMGTMLQELEAEYDYVFVDTAPSMLLADTFLISKYADVTLYVVRTGFTKKNVINFAVDASKEGKLKNMNFVLNDVGLDNLGYGSKYGYVYGEDQPGFWQKLKHSF